MSEGAKRLDAMDARLQQLAALVSALKGESMAMEAAVASAVEVVPRDVRGAWISAFNVRLNFFRDHAMGSSLPEDSIDTMMATAQRIMPVIQAPPEPFDRK